MPLEPGRTIAHYRIDQKIGERRARFEREARAIAVVLLKRSPS